MNYLSNNPKPATVIVFTVLLFIAPTASAEIDNFDIGGDFLFQYFWGDNFDLTDNTNDEVDFLRTEFHLWFQTDLDDNIMVRISLEADRALNQLGAGNTNVLDANGIGDLEVFVDEAYVKIADIAMSGFSASLGRQYLNFGDDPNAYDFNRWWGAGFLIGDSQPNSPLILSQLGSHEIDPFDAIVINYETVEASYNLIHARDVEDSILGGPGNPTNDDATLTALYTSFYGIENHQIDVYAAYHDQNGPAGSLTYDGEKWILGARAAGDLNEALAYKTELAYQIENRRDFAAEVDALAAQAGLNYHPESDFNPNIGIIYTYFQHDGQRGAMNGFSAPFEGKVYGSIADGVFKTMTGLNPITNMHIFNLRGGWEPWTRVGWNADLSYFLLDEEMAGSKDGRIEFDSQIDYQFNDYLTSFIEGGMFFPGEAFENLRNDDENAVFFQAGVKVTF